MQDMQAIDIPMNIYRCFVLTVQKVAKFLSIKTKRQVNAFHYFLPPCYPLMKISAWNPYKVIKFPLLKTAVPEKSYDSSGTAFIFPAKCLWMALVPDGMAYSSGTRLGFL